MPPHQTVNKKKEEEEKEEREREKMRGTCKGDKKQEGKDIMSVYFVCAV